MANFYKIDCGGVSQFIPENKVRIASDLKRDFDAKPVLDNGAVKLYSSDDIVKIQRDQGKRAGNINRESMESLFGLTK